MKIIFVIASMEAGGAERVLSLLANYFINYFDIVILTLWSDESFYKLDSKIKVKGLNIAKEVSKSSGPISNNIYRINILKSEFRKEKPDLVVSFMTETNIVSIIAAKMLGIKVIVSERSNYNFLTSFFWKLLRRYVYPFADFLVVQSNFDYEKYFFIKQKSIIQNPVSMPLVDGKQERKKIILAVGRLVKVKGFDLLIEAFSTIHTDWQLQIIGEGPERSSLEKLISEKNLKEKIELLGRKNNVKDYYSGASIFVLSSRMEGFPNVLVEAMSIGCACVAFDCLTGPSDLIEHRKSGLLVEAENILELSESLKELIDNSNLRRQLSQNALNIRDNLSLTKITQEWCNLFQVVTKKDFLCVE